MTDTAWFTINGTVLTQCSPQASGCVTIPSGVTRIEERAFKNCTGITALWNSRGNTIYKKKEYPEPPSHSSVQYKYDGWES